MATESSQGEWESSKLRAVQELCRKCSRLREFVDSWNDKVAAGAEHVPSGAELRNVSMLREAITQDVAAMAEQLRDNSHLQPELQSRIRDCVGTACCLLTETGEGCEALTGRALDRRAEIRDRLNSIEQGLRTLRSYKRTARMRAPTSR